MILFSAILLSLLIWFLFWKEVFECYLDVVRARSLKEPRDMPAGYGPAPHPALGHGRIFKVHCAGQG